jgi:hypothetical protein
MENSLGQSIVVGIVALLSALLGGFIPHFLQKRSALVSLKREKLEELYPKILIKSIPTDH